mgnify:CR=1 FL=1
MILDATRSVDSSPQRTAEIIRILAEHNIEVIEGREVLPEATSREPESRDHRERGCERDCAVSL